MQISIKNSIIINVGVRTEIKKNIICAKEYIYFWNSARCSCKNGKYLGRVIENSVITCDKIMDTTKSASTKIVPRKKLFQQKVL